MIKTPIYYAGKKEKLLDQILPFFPTNTKIFYDIFSGSCSVGINCGEKSQEVIFVDNCKPLQGITSLIKDVPYSLIEDFLKNIVEENNGLNTKEDYLKFRTKVQYHYSALDLLVLTTACFNNQMRFNQKGGFNAPFGYRCSLENMLEKLKSFSEEIKKEKYHIVCKNYEDILGLILIAAKDSFVYLDPPYLGSDATYNADWDEGAELKLYEFIETINSAGVKFCLSNNKNYNPMIKELVSKYEVVDLDWNYNSCSYHKKDRKQKTGEILIKNY